MAQDTSVQSLIINKLTTEQYESITDLSSEELYFVTDGNTTQDRYVDTGRLVGDIFFTSRSETMLGGAVVCDGSNYILAGLTDGGAELTTLLSNGNLPYVTRAQFNTSVGSNGSCRAFGWDGADDTGVLVPQLNDVYIKAGTATSEDEYLDESLPNIEGTVTGANEFGLYGGFNSASGAFYLSSPGQVVDSPAGGSKNRQFNFDASRSSSVYQTNAKVQPDSIRYQAMVQLTPNTIPLSESVSVEGSFLGNITHSLRTDVPFGFRACDGSLEYLLGTHLVGFKSKLDDGTIQSISLEEWESRNVANGQVGVCGYDAETGAVRWPNLTDIIIKGTGDLSELGEFSSESLPNITGTSHYVGACLNNNNTSKNTGVFTAVDSNNGGFCGGGGHSNAAGRLVFNASNSSSTYQDGAKVQPEVIKLRFLIHVSTGVVEESEENQASLMNDMTNLKNGSGFSALGVNTIVGWGMPSSSKYINLSFGESLTKYVAPADGYYLISANGGTAGWLILENVTACYIGMISVSTSYSTTILAYVPCTAGETVRIKYGGTMTSSNTIYNFKFIYANGAT